MFPVVPIVVILVHDHGLGVDRGEDVVHQVIEVKIRGREPLEQFQLDQAIGIDGEDPGRRHMHTSIRDSVGDPVAKASVKRIAPTKEPLDILETGHLEDFGLAHDDFAVEGGEEAIGRENDRAIG